MLLKHRKYLQMVDVSTDFLFALKKKKKKNNPMQKYYI